MFLLFPFPFSAVLHVTVRCTHTHTYHARIVQGYKVTCGMESQPSKLRQGKVPSKETDLTQKNVSSVYSPALGYGPFCI